MDTDTRSALTMIISKLRSEWSYISGRVAALASRPLMLLALNYWGGNDVAASVAVVFLMTMLAAAVSAFDTHRGFYQAYFSELRSRGLSDSYRLYCSATCLQVALVSPLLAVFMIYRFGDPILAALVVAYFASERLADEAQRFLIFAGQRREWGRRIMAKALLQLGGLIIAVAMLGSAATQLAIAFLTIGNLAAYGIKLPWNYLPNKWQDLMSSIIACMNQQLFWLLSVITSLISYFDRVIVMLFQQSDMAIYTILVSSMSIVQNAVDYFFVSLRRRDILRGQLTLVGVFLNRQFYITLGIAAVAGCVVSGVMLRLYHGQQINNIELVPIVLLSQLALSVTLILREIIYWNHSVQRLVLLEGGFILTALAVSSVLRAFGQGYEVVLGMISILFTLRMSLMIWGFSRIGRQSSVT